MLQRQPSAGGRELVPASKTNGWDQGRGCHLTGDMEGAGRLAGVGEQGAAPLGVREGRRAN